MNAVNRKLSIITINYNNLEGLKKTISSVVNQTWQEFEYIVIDGGSTDGSAAYLETQNDKIDYWVSEKDSGIYNAMNKGIKVAKGEYLLFLNSGDHFYDLEVLEKNHEYICDADIICFNLKYFENDIAETLVYPDKIRFSYFIERSIGHQSTFIGKNLFIKFGLYDENYQIVSDWYFFMKVLFLENCTYKKVEAILSVFYSGGISCGSNNFVERDVVLTKYFHNLMTDYNDLFAKRFFYNSKRVKMLFEIENSTIARKMVTVIFRTYIFLFSKKKLKDVLK